MVEARLVVARLVQFLADLIRVRRNCHKETLAETQQQATRPHPGNERLGEKNVEGEEKVWQEEEEEEKKS